MDDPNITIEEYIRLEEEKARRQVFDDTSDEALSCEPTGAEKVTGADLFYLRTMDRGTANVPYLLAQYLFRYAEGRKSRARLSGGHFIGFLVAHFGLFTFILRLLRITWAWVCALGPRWRQQAIAAGALKAAEDAPAADEGAQAVPAPVQAPQLSPPAHQHWTMSQRIDRLEEEVCKMRQSVVGLRGVVESSITEQTRVSTWMISCMPQLMDVSGRTY
ncbi:hypothetical protein Tco_0763099 [Tanacetum coccineum]